MSKDYYVAGSWNAVCDRCGFEFKSHELRREWTGLMVCKGCWETRHPQTLIKVPRERVAVPWTRPEPADVFLSDTTNITTEYDLEIVIEADTPFNVLTTEV